MTEKRFVSLKNTHVLFISWLTYFYFLITYIFIQWMHKNYKNNIKISNSIKMYKVTKLQKHIRNFVYRCRNENIFRPQRLMLTHEYYFPKWHRIQINDYIFTISAVTKASLKYVSVSDKCLRKQTYDMNHRYNMYWYVFI